MLADFRIETQKANRSLHNTGKTLSDCIRVGFLSGILKSGLQKLQKLLSKMLCLSKKANRYLGKALSGGMLPNMPTSALSCGTIHGA